MAWFQPNLRQTPASFNPACRRHAVLFLSSPLPARLRPSAPEDMPLPADTRPPSPVPPPHLEVAGRAEDLDRLDVAGALDVDWYEDGLAGPRLAQHGDGGRRGRGGDGPRCCRYRRPLPDTCGRGEHGQKTARRRGVERGDLPVDGSGSEGAWRDRSADSSGRVRSGSEIGEGTGQQGESARRPVPAHT